MRTEISLSKFWGDPEIFFFTSALDDFVESVTELTF